MVSQNFVFLLLFRLCLQWQLDLQFMMWWSHGSRFPLERKLPLRWLEKKQAVNCLPFTLVKVINWGLSRCYSSPIYANEEFDSFGTLMLGVIHERYSSIHSVQHWKFSCSAFLLRAYIFHVKLFNKPLKSLAHVLARAQEGKKEKKYSIFLLSVHILWNFLTEQELMYLMTRKFHIECTSVWMFLSPLSFRGFLFQGNTYYWDPVLSTDIHKSHWINI